MFVCSRICKHAADVSITVSIARRLQDPLAELIKIDPKNIGVGMYQVWSISAVSWFSCYHDLIS